MGLEEPRHDTRTAEGVEYPKPGLAKAPLNSLNCDADLAEERSLVPDVGDQLPSEILLAFGARIVGP